MNVYIIAPENRVSGGPELAHQLCNALNRLTDIKSSMCYITTTRPYTLAYDVPAPEPYAIYETDHITDVSIMDTPDSIVVIPEGLTQCMPVIKKAKKVLWWMSVDNYIKSTNESNLDYISNNTFFHLFQSHYSIAYVKKKIPSAKGMYLSDYINEAHGTFIFPAEYRKNIALYNPAKGYDEIKPLIAMANWLDWVPLANLPVEKMVFLMQVSKIYVDFGEHPGKDRIPREAAANGCCVIVNKKGAANFVEDVPIPEQFKFENPASSLNEIDLLMHKICDNYKTYQDMFAGYRTFIQSEKKVFEEDTVKFAEFVKNQ